MTIVMPYIAKYFIKYNLEHGSPNSLTKPPPFQKFEKILPP